MSILKKRKTQLICLAGFMKILSGNFIKRFKGKILNIHPSLLPKYKGLNTHERAIANKEKFSGCSVHFVTKKLKLVNKFFGKNFKPYIIGKISSNNKKVKISGKVSW